MKHMNNIWQGDDAVDLKQLEYFVTIVEEGTISAAAKKLFLSQPPLSVKMHELEKDLGCQLFERTPRQVILTEAGKLLYERAQSLLNMVEATKDEVSALGTNVDSVIRIGIVSSMAHSSIADKIIAFTAQHPGSTVDIYEANTYQLIERIRTRTVHFSIVRTPFPANHFKQIPLLADHIVAVAGDRFFKPGQDAVSIEELAEYPLILYRRWNKLVHEIFSQHYLSPHLACCVDDARTALFFASRNMGVALIPSSVLSPSADSPAVYRREISGHPMETHVVLQYDEETYIPQIAKQMIAFLTSQP